MSITIEEKSNYSLLKIREEKLNSVNSPDLKSQLVFLSKQGSKNIIVDMDDVQFCDSSGLSALLIGNRLCNEQEGKFVINSLQDMVKKMIEISQLDKVLHITNEINQAEEMMS